MPKHLYVFILALLWVAIPVGSRGGGIDFLREERVVWATSFPESRPATLDDVLAADRAGGWSVVAYDAATDTWTLDASLHIGSEEDFGTFMQIGRQGHPDETVIVKGDVWIRPPRESMERTDGRAAIVNRLTLGDPRDSTIRPVLKIACTRPREFGIHLGIRNRERWTYGGDLFVFNGTITAATPDSAHLLRGFGFGREKLTGWFARRVILVNARLSWIGDRVMYGVTSGRQPGMSRIEDTTFEHCGTVLTGYRHELHGCVFRDNDCVVAVNHTAVLEDCVLEGNRANWSFGGGRNATELRFVDCGVGPAVSVSTLRKNQLRAEDLARGHRQVYPECLEVASVVVKVVDPEGRPVRRAVVMIDSDAGRGAVARGYAITDGKGMTPDDPKVNALLVVRRRTVATDVTEQPRVAEYSHKLSVLTDAYPTVQVELKAGEPVSRPWVVRVGGEQAFTEKRP